MKFGKRLFEAAVVAGVMGMGGTAGGDKSIQIETDADLPALVGLDNNIVVRKPEAAKGAKEKKLPVRAVAWVDEAQTVPLMWHPRGLEYPEAPKKRLEQFEGRDSKGNIAEVSLDRDAHNAWDRLRVDFEENAPPELKAFGCYLVHGFRSYAEQAAVKAEADRLHPQKRGHSLAAPVGSSIHHTAFGADVFLADRAPMYSWFMGTAEELADPNFVPRFVRYGFVPTEPAEPWHVVYAGKAGEVTDDNGKYVANENALLAWSKYRKLVTDKEKGHPLFLRSSLPPRPDLAPATVAIKNAGQEPS